MKNLLFLIITVSTVFATTAQTKIAGVTLPNTLNYGQEQLVLNGAGVREKFWMDMYAGGLYLEQKSSNANAILNGNDAMAIRIHIVSKMITSDKMIDAVNEGFQNSTNGNTRSIQKEIDQFIGFFRDEIKKNDIFDIVYLPNQGVVVYKNGKQRGTIKGDNFKKALFGIWLSDKPADEDVKKGMLGR